MLWPSIYTNKSKNRPIQNQTHHAHQPRSSKWTPKRCRSHTQTTGRRTQNKIKSSQNRYQSTQRLTQRTRTKSGKLFICPQSLEWQAIDRVETIIREKSNRFEEKVWPKDAESKKWNVKLQKKFNKAVGGQKRWQNKEINNRAYQEIFRHQGILHINHSHQSRSHQTA